jgi:hypothetical protein
MGVYLANNEFTHYGIVTTDEQNDAILCHAVQVSNPRCSLPIRQNFTDDSPRVRKSNLVKTPTTAPVRVTLTLGEKSNVFCTTSHDKHVTHGISHTKVQR